MAAQAGSGILQRKCACGNHTAAGGECKSCQKKKKGTLQRKSARAAETGYAPSIVHEVLRSPGKPLHAATRAFMERRFGADFSGVRVHTDAKAAKSALAVDASAYTVGQHLVFGVDQFRPHSAQGRSLLAHELTHVLQQDDSVAHSRRLRIGGVDTSQERQADAAAATIHLAHPLADFVTRSSPTMVQRQIETAAVPKEAPEELPVIDTSLIACFVLCELGLDSAAITQIIKQLLEVIDSSLASQANDIANDEPLKQAKDVVRGLSGLQLIGEAIGFAVTGNLSVPVIGGELSIPQKQRAQLQSTMLELLTKNAVGDLKTVGKFIGRLSIPVAIATGSVCAGQCGAEAVERAVQTLASAVNEGLDSLSAVGDTFAGLVDQGVQRLFEGRARLDTNNWDLSQVRTPRLRNAFVEFGVDLQPVLTIDQPLTLSGVLELGRALDSELGTLGVSPLSLLNLVEALNAETGSQFRPAEILEMTPSTFIEFFSRPGGPITFRRNPEEIAAEQIKRDPSSGTPL